MSEALALALSGLALALSGLALRRSSRAQRAQARREHEAPPGPQQPTLAEQWAVFDAYRRKRFERDYQRGKAGRRHGLG